MVTLYILTQRGTTKCVSCRFIIFLQNKGMIALKSQQQKYKRSIVFSVNCHLR